MARKNRHKEKQFREWMMGVFKGKRSPYFLLWTSTNKNWNMYNVVISYSQTQYCARELDISKAEMKAFLLRMEKEYIIIRVNAFRQPWREGNGKPWESYYWKLPTAIEVARLKIKNET